MGVTFSQTRGVLIQDIMTQSINNCGAVTASNVATLKNVVIEPPSWCGPDASFTIQQSTSVDANCIIDNAQKQLIDTISKMSADAKGGLFGVSGSNVEQNIEQHVKNFIENKCTDVKTLNELKLEDVHIKACKSSIIQVADAKTLCKLKNTQDLVNKVQATGEAKSSGFNLFDCSSPGVAIFWIVLVIVVVGAGIWFFKNYGKDIIEMKKGKGKGMKSKKKMPQ